MSNRCAVAERIIAQFPRLTPHAPRAAERGCALPLVPAAHGLKRPRTCFPALVIETFFGHGRDLDALQMALRSVVLFIAALVLIRIGGMRAFGRKSSFDSVIVIMLGAVLSRPVVGASAFWPTLAGATALVTVHRTVGMLTARWRWFERLVKGSSQTVYRDGRDDIEAMMRSGISTGDLDEAARRNALRPDRTGLAAIVMETSGELSVIDRERA